MTTALASWLVIGYAFNYLSVMALYEDTPSFIATMLSFALCWIGPFAIINVIGLALLGIIDIIYFSKTFEKIRSKYFTYIYNT